MMIVLVVWVAFWILITYIFMIVESDFIVRFIDLEEEVFSFYKRDLKAYQKIEDFVILIERFSSTLGIIKTGVLLSIATGFVGILGVVAISFVDPSFTRQGEWAQFAVAFVIGLVYAFFALSRNYLSGKKLVDHFFKVENY